MVAEPTSKPAANFPRESARFPVENIAKSGPQETRGSFRSVEPDSLLHQRLDVEPTAFRGHGLKSRVWGDSEAARTIPTVAAIPAFNEAVSIGSVVLQAKQYVDEVVVVDDGSSDETAAIAEMAGAIVIRHKQNSGKGAAIRTLFDWARENGAEHLVLLDGDGQHDPAEIPKLLEPVMDHRADIALGFRYGKNTEMPSWRRVGKRVLDFATAAGTEGQVTDSQCGYRAFNRSAIQSLRLQETGFGVESEMVIRGKEAGLSFHEVPINCKYEGLDGSTLGPFAHAAGVLNSVVKMIGERRPLIALGIPAAFSFAFGAILGLRVLLTLQTERELAVGSAVLSSLLILAGMFLALTALVLHVIPSSIAKQIRISTDEAKGSGYTISVPKSS